MSFILLGVEEEEDDEEDEEEVEEGEVVTGRMRKDRNV